MALQLQQLQDQNLKQQPLHLLILCTHLVVHHQNPGPEIGVTFAINWILENRLPSKVLCKSLDTNSDVPMSILKENTRMFPSQGWWDSKRFSNKKSKIAEANESDIAFDIQMELRNRKDNKF